MTTYTSVNSAQFVSNNLGVNIHVLWTNTAYGNLSAVRSGLSYLGFQNVRDGADGATSGSLAANKTLASQGVHFDIEVPTPATLSSFHTYVDQLQSAYPGAITSIEGPNEVNGWPVTYNGLTGTAGAIALQTDLYNMLRADPLFAKTPIYNFTLASSNLSDYQALGNLSGIANAMPQHYYYGGGSVAGWWPTELSFAQAVVPNEPQHVFSEIGSSTAPTVNWGVDETVQAKQSLDVVMDAARNNSRVFFYELVDENYNNTPLENNYGLFHSDWTPKPAATALHNLTTILTTGADPNAAPDSFSYSVSGLPSTGYSMVFEKTASIHDIAVWNDPSLWNNTTHTEIAVASQPITVNLGATYASVDVYDPLTGAASIQHLTNVSTVNLSLPDHPLIIEVNSSGASTPPASPPPPPPSPPPPPPPPPAAPSGLADGAIAGGYVNAAHNTASQALTGTAVAGATVTVYDGATALGTTTANATTGQWSYTLGSLADGGHSLSATATTSAGVSAKSAALGFTVDTIAPTAPTGLADSAIVGGVVDAAHDTASQALTGTAEAGSTVTVYDGAAKLGVASASSAGQWSYTLGQLADGAHSLTATATDAAGNLGAASSALSFTVNTQSPPATPPASPPPSSGGVTLTGTGYYDTLVGGPGNDTLIASTQGSETMTGGAGADTFQFNTMPWTPSHITDFQPGVDKLDLHALFATYSGSDPIKDGYVTLGDDGHGGTNVLVNPDGHATAANPWPTYVVDLDHVSPAGLTSAQLFGGGSTPPTQPVSPPPVSPPPVSPPPPTSGGVTLTGSGYNYNLTGGAGNDTLIGSVQGSGTMTGGAGADTFEFNTMPWTPSHVTDFQVGVDKLDLHALYPTYTGTNPVKDGYVTIMSDGHGGTNVLVNPDGHATAANPWPTYVVDLDNVAPSSLASASNWLV